jgi:FimV-like protein
VVINPIIAETADTTPNKAREPTEAVVPKTALLDTRAIDTLPPELLVIQQNLKKALSENVFLKKSNQKLQQQVAQLQQENEHLQTQFAAKVTVASPATAKPIVTTTSSSMKTNKTAIVKPAVEPGIFTVIMDFWWQILVILALLLFLIIWGVVRKRNNKPKPEPSSSTHSEDIGPELDIDIVSEDEPTIDIHNIESAPEEINTDVIVDVNSILPEVTVKEVRRKKPKVELNAASATEILHEAKLYLDYGSNEQAKEMLETVAALESTDDAIWEELLCLYASLNDSKGLASMITKIPPGLLKDEKSNLWKKIELLRQKNDAPKSAIDIVASAIIEDGKVDASDDEAKFDDTANEADAFSFTAAEEQIELTLLDEVNAPAANDDSEDLIELPEGDETQLDLATAYLAMDDHKAAKKVLLALLKSNEPAIKQKAEALLDTLKD